jgi:hypothetical protein
LENEDPLAPRKALAALEPIDRRLPTMADVAREAAVSPVSSRS